LLTIGRDPSCDLVVEPLVVSGRHARLLRSGSLLVIEDLRSSNGTFVNGRRVNDPTPVKPGDLIGLGAHTMRLVDGEAPPAFAVETSSNAVDAKTSGARGATARGPIRLVLLAAFAIQPPLVALTILVLVAYLGPAGQEAGARSVLVGSLFGLSLGAVWLGLVASTAHYLDRSAAGSARHGSSPGELSTTLALGAGSLLLGCGVTFGLVSMRVNLAGDWFSTIALMSLTALAGFSVGRVLIGMTGRLTVATALGLGLFLLMLGPGGPRWPLPALNSILQGVSAALPSRWAFEGLLLLNDSTAAEATAAAEDLAEPYFPAETERMGVTACVSALALMVVGLVLLDVVISLSARERRAGA
jgi:hypothetical protein